MTERSNSNQDAGRTDPSRSAPSRPTAMPATALRRRSPRRRSTRGSAAGRTRGRPGRRSRDRRSAAPDARPRTSCSDRSPTGPEKLRDRAVQAATDAGQGRLDELGLTRQKGIDTIRSIIEGAGEAARASAQAALGTVRKGD